MKHKHFLFRLGVVFLIATSMAVAWDFDTGVPDFKTTGRNCVLLAYEPHAITIMYCTTYVPGPNRIRQTAANPQYNATSAGWAIGNCTRVWGSVTADFLGTINPDSIRVTPQFSCNGGVSWSIPAACDTDAVNKGDNEIRAEGTLNISYKYGPLCADSAWWGDRMRLMIITAYEGDSTSVDSTAFYSRIFGLNEKQLKVVY